jgi:hypothetical protein
MRYQFSCCVPFWPSLSALLSMRRRVQNTVSWRARKARITLILKKRKGPETMLEKDARKDMEKAMGKLVSRTALMVGGSGSSAMGVFVVDAP